MKNTVGFRFIERYKAAGSCDLHNKSPHVICGVSQTQFSVSRYYGGCVFNGFKYVYDPTEDTLIREDVLKWLWKCEDNKKRKTKYKRSANAQAEMNLQ